jgi:hypothetical protein
MDCTTTEQSGLEQRTDALPFPLMQLPQELRNQIYKYTLLNEDNEIDATDPIDLLSINQQIRREVKDELAHLCQSNINFDFFLRDGCIRNFTLHLLRKANRISIDTNYDMASILDRPNIRYLRFRFFTTKIPRTPWYEKVRMWRQLSTIRVVEASVDITREPSVFSSNLELVMMGQETLCRPLKRYLEALESWEQRGCDERERDPAGLHRFIL